MHIAEVFFNDVKVIQSDIFQDSRGLFMEKYNQASFASLGIDVRWCQDNLSVSHKNVVRGLHYQASPHEQAKFVSCIRGSILDIVLDIRHNSPTFGQAVTIKLLQNDGKAVYVPAGFAHGFISLEDDTIVCYKVSNLYDKNSDRSIDIFDPKLNINLGISINDALRSEKDARGVTFASYILSPDF